MNTCPITYRRTSARYSREGLDLLRPGLPDLADLPYTAEEQFREAARRSRKMSIQGAQPKLSAVFDAERGSFVVVDVGGRYILKPRNPLYPELPENEDVTMRMAEVAGIETPFHGLVYAMDGTLTYFVRRFDRGDDGRRVPLEDFAQLLGLSRDTKYNASMEKLVGVIDRFCARPEGERLKLFRLTIFCFLTGNEDMHLKNFSLVTASGRVMLSPAYDLLNTSIAIGDPSEEMAMPLKGKKRKLTADILVDYFGGERLRLSGEQISAVMERLRSSCPKWRRLIEIGFLSEEMKAAYLNLLQERGRRLFGPSF